MVDKAPPVSVSLGFGLAPRAKSSRSRKAHQEPDPEPKARILLVDNDLESRRFMNARLGAANYSVELANGGADALDRCVRSRPNLVITDLHLDGMDGLALLKELKSRWPALTVIILTAHATIAEAVQATQCGAFGFLVKPVEKAELLGQVHRAVATSTFALVKGDWRADIVSRSQLMEERLGLANRAAGSDASVLLTGENGTGKELLARAIHAASSRRGGLFVAVRCKDAREDTLESELFGRAPRGDVGASPQGAIAAARGGTLLLDEIGLLPVRLQAELLAALSRPIPDQGGARSPACPRLISTTSVDLGKLMAAGAFRQDLYYHINILPIEIPPLGRRREDIPLLVSHFLEQATEDGGTKKIYSADAIELLATTDWPGNVRQLFELVKQNVALSHGKIMSKEFVERSLGSEAKKVPTYEEARDTFARNYLTHNLQSTSGNVSESARLAKRNRTDFYKLLARYRLEPDDFKGGGRPRTEKKSGTKS
ncbi:MAG: sigma 54-interacting transcriptional regulator [Pseudomonadota bacterium]|nr:sigma 54-interacting transcriptional regulator [Pseudomonadota bacterium]